MSVTQGINMAILLVVMTSYTFGAPVSDIAQDTAEITGSAANSNQDADLQDLMNLVNKQASRQNVMVHKQQMTHFENNNGKTTEVKEEEEKVVDTKTGDVIADVKQEVKQESSPDGQEPEAVVETKVDIPSEGVHETVVQGNPEVASQDGVPSNGDLIDDLSPADMAEFLYTTQQFDLFDNALNKLVNQSKMTAEEAEEYAKVVALEYQRIQLEEPMLDEMMDSPVVAQRSLVEPSLPYEGNYAPDSPVEYGPLQWPAQYPMVPGEYPTEALMTPEEKYLNLLQQQQRQEEELLAEDDISPYDFLSALWEEAYGKGNVEAQAIVQMLYDRVSVDGNTDDMGQIRDILVDSLASSMNESPDLPETIEVPSQENIQVPGEPQNAQEESEVREEEQKKEVEEEEEKEESKTEEVKEETKESVKEEKEAEKTEDGSASKN